MAAARKISDAEWNIHKARLHALYIGDNKTLDQVIEIAACDLGFKSSKAQYIRQFKKWAFEKNSNIDQWKAVTRVVCKRKFRGKDTEISIKGRRISDRKLRKEMSRYTVPNNDQECSSKKSRPALSDRRDNTSQRSDLLRPWWCCRANPSGRIFANIRIPPYSLV
ncbi:MAG: hypothetical protein Q9164_007082 [Protoblastenia rupestris]